MYRVILSAMYDDKSLAWEDKEKWVRDNLGFSEKEARDVIYALEGFSNMTYHSIHTQDFASYNGDMYRKDAEIIDKLLLNPNMPKYEGTLYRGLAWSFKDDEIAKLENILNSGVWHEPGITSFTTDPKIAKRFCETDSLHYPVFLTLHGNKHGCEVGFLSQVGGESEVLYPGIIARRGLKIIDWHSEILSQRISRKTGKPVILKEAYFAELEDW